MDNNVSVHQKIDTVLNADSVEFCPYYGDQNIIICGTYKLQETQSQQSPEDDTDQDSSLTATPQTRLGGVSVYRLACKDGKPQLSDIGKIDMCGVLDTKWPGRRIDDKNLFGLVDAEGFFQIFQVSKDESQPNMVAKEILSESSLGLSLGWDGGRDRPCTKAAASDSKGCINVFSFGNGELLSEERWLAHDYEAWITAFHDFDSNVLYSGGDDCTLKGWDLRDTTRPIFVSRRHTMGVCSIQSHPFDEFIYATGSYDEELLIWDRRQQKRPIADTNLGGGVWRIKWDPFYGQYILTATMYNGTHIVNCKNLDASPLPIETQHNDHNLAYGADWCRLDKDLNSISNKDKGQGNGCSGETPQYLISTCSFYDHSLHLWEWSPDV